MKRFFKWVLSALYGLVMIEVIVMISPFAFYWYSLYAPTLQTLHRWRATAWMEAFFLPHSVITTSPTLEFLRWQVGTYAFSLGVLAAVFTGLQVYFSGLVRRKAATSWLYSRIRHPFYLSLSVAAFGLLTIWPRIIILFLYVLMLIIYYLLARLEEKQLEAKYPDYAAYRARTWMFLPGDPGGKLFRLLFGWIPNRGAALGACCAASVAFAAASGVLLRRYTIHHSATDLLPEDQIVAIAIWPMPSEKIQRVVTAALADSHVRQKLAAQSGAVFTAHVLPADYGMINMFADVGTDHRMFTRLSPSRFKYLLGFVFPYFDRGRKFMIMGSPQEGRPAEGKPEEYKVVFSRVDEPGRPSITVDGVADLSAKMTPVVIAEVRGPNFVPSQVIDPPPRSFWGDITMPMY